MTCLPLGLIIVFGLAGVLDSACEPPRYSIDRGTLAPSSGPGSSGSPPLSSPEHALFRGWQAAQSGLASGLVPQLTPASSGGTYFCKGSDGTKVAVLKPSDEVHPESHPLTPLAGSWNCFRARCRLFQGQLH